MTRGHDEPRAMTAATPEALASHNAEACWHALGAPAVLASVEAGPAGLPDAGPPRRPARARKRI